MAEGQGRRGGDGPCNAAPRGYRLLFQCFEAATEAEASEYVAFTFKRTDAMFKRGTYRLQGKNAHKGPSGWKYTTDGYMAFVPNETPPQEAGKPAPQDSEARGAGPGA